VAAGESCHRPAVADRAFARTALPAGQGPQARGLARAAEAGSASAPAAFLAESSEPEPEPVAGKPGAMALPPHYLVVRDCYREAELGRTAVV